MGSTKSLLFEVRALELVKYDNLISYFCHLQYFKIFFILIPFNSFKKEQYVYTPGFESKRYLICIESMLRNFAGYWLADGFHAAVA